MDLLDDIGAERSVGDGIYDQDVSDALQDCGSQLVPSTGCDELVLRTENDCEMRLELTGKEGDDVHVLPGRMS
jgi:hypothetical protein